MTGYVGNIEEKTLTNSYFRKVVFTGTYCQLVVMSLKPGEEIGSEVHKSVDQFFRIEKGRGKVIIGGAENQINEVYFNHCSYYLGCSGNFRSFPFNWLGSCIIVACNGRDNYWNCGSSNRFYEVINYIYYFKSDILRKT